MSNIEVHIDFAGGKRRVGSLRVDHGRRGQSVSFEYDEGWLGATDSFSLEPSLVKGAGVFPPGGDRAIFGSMGDSAPDTWGRELMRKRERRLARSESRNVRTLQEIDFLLGVSDIARLGALRFRRDGESVFQAPSEMGVPGLIALGDLLAASERTLRDEETDEDLLMIFAPGSSLGGARPKASVLDQNNQLSIAKFPKETDSYSNERWEKITLDLAAAAGIRVATTELVQIDRRPVLLSRRFDRTDDYRVPFVSALSMMQLKDGERASYPELADVIARYGAQAKDDATELFRRMVFNILVSNVDDHLRNHGFLWTGSGGWALCPAYDLNPVPVDIKPRILTTGVDLDEFSADIELARSVAGYFGLQKNDSDPIIGRVAAVTQTWRTIARRVGAPPSEIDRMESAFEHDDLKQALRLQ